MIEADVDAVLDVLREIILQLASDSTIARKPDAPPASCRLK
jgi:hypothetical protein